MQPNCTPTSLLVGRHPCHPGEFHRLEYLCPDGVNVQNLNKNIKQNFHSVPFFATFFTEASALPSQCCSPSRIVFGRNRHACAARDGQSISRERKATKARKGTEIEVTFPIPRRLGSHGLLRSIEVLKDGLFHLGLFCHQSWVYMSLAARSRFRNFPLDFPVKHVSFM